MYLEIKNVTKTIQKEDILKNITCSMEKGKIYGFRGKNGSGKTMLMKTICGLIRPTSGSVYIEGQCLGVDMDFPESVGILIENPGFIGNYSAFDNLKLLADIKGLIGDDEIKQVLAEVGLNEREKKKVKKYSLGMKQRLGIAAAIMESPELIILDEPTNALDEAGVLELRKLLIKHKERGALILLCSHDLEEIQYLSDEIFILENGAIKERYSMIQSSKIREEDGHESKSKKEK